MTKEGRDIALAFREGRPLTRRRTMTTGLAVWLHASVIARRDTAGLVWLTLAGWPTVTTRDRLNAICQAFGRPSGFHQLRFQQYFGDMPLDSNEWVPLCGKLGLMAIEAERRVA